jgi:hypothetical protein
VEQPLPATGTAEFAIGPIKETRSADSREVFVEGTVRNTGSRPSHDVKVWVSALDATGQRLTRVEVVPTPQEIPPGGTASFLVRFANSPAMRTFHVEAIGR